MSQSSQLPSDTPAQQEWIHQLIQTAQLPQPPPTDEGTGSQHQPTATNVVITTTAGMSIPGNLGKSTGNFPK